MTGGSAEIRIGHVGFHRARVIFDDQDREIHAVALKRRRAPRQRLECALQAAVERGSDESARHRACS